jgi:Lon protease-like protein
VLTGLFTGAGRGQSVKLPVFPFTTVLFPGGLLPLRVFEARYMDMVKDCLKDDRAFGICSMRSYRRNPKRYC